MMAEQPPAWFVSGCMWTLFGIILFFAIIGVLTAAAWVLS